MFGLLYSRSGVCSLALPPSAIGWYNKVHQLQYFHAGLPRSQSHEPSKLLLLINYPVCGVWF
jgi:hypothetical protein